MKQCIRFSLSEVPVFSRDDELGFSSADEVALEYLCFTLLDSIVVKTFSLSGAGGFDLTAASLQQQFVPPRADGTQGSVELSSPEAALGAGQDMQ